MHTERTTYDVLVAGAGPAGLTTAIGLARHGLRPLVVERHPGTSVFPKATGVSTRTMEILRGWGLADEVAGLAQPLRTTMAVTRRLVDPPRAVLSEGFPTEAEAHAVSPVAPVACAQDLLEPVLLRHLREHGGEVAFGTELVRYAQDGDGVTVTLRSRDDGTERTVDAAYLVGADGSRGPVRELAGIAVEELGNRGDYLSVLFRAPLAERVPPPLHAIYLVEEAGAEGVYVAVGAGRWLHGRALAPGESPADWTSARVADTIRRGTGIPGLRPDVVATMPFRMAARHAAAYRAGRVFLVGDAAHTVTPIGGTGLNTAVHAAHQLGWMLAWVLRGWAGEALLDRYEAERRPIGERVVRASLVPGARTVTQAMAADLEGRAPHVWVAPHTSTLDLFEGRLTVLTGPRGRGWREAAAELSGAGLPVAAYAAGADLSDVDGALVRAYGLGEDGAVLVRPDGQIGWRSAGGGADPWAALAGAVAATLGDPLATAAR